MKFTPTLLQGAAGLALSTLLLAACSHDTDKPQAQEAQGPQLSFTISTADAPEAENEPSPQNAPHSATRAAVTQGANLGNFQLIGYRAAEAEDFTFFENDLWFAPTTANPEGVLSTNYYWSASKPYAQFFGIHPLATAENGLVLAEADQGTLPHFDFSVKSNAYEQTDLMTAYSGVVKYTPDSPIAPTALKFQHALTAVRFRLGENLPTNKTITRIDLTGAQCSGRFHFSGTNESVGFWSLLSNAQTVSLTDLNISTSQSPNTLITGQEGDALTFFMIPQSLTTQTVQAVIHFSDKSKLTARLAGQWLPHTTKTYTLTQGAKTWE